MPTIVIRVRGNPRAKLARLRQKLRGSAGQKVLRAMGLAMLQEIHKAFLVKSAGGTDEAGERWAALAKFTVAKKKQGKYARNATAILMESEALVRSLEPPKGSGRNKYQVFKVANGEMTLGTTRPWAQAHQAGIPPWLPQRRLWPPLSQWPQSWWKKVADAAKMALVELIKETLKS